MDTTGTFIGVVSDTHGLYDEQFDELLAGAAHIIHAGDINDPTTLVRLRRLAPLTAVAGNTDLHDPRFDLPWEAQLEVAGLRVLVCHILESLMRHHDPVAEGFDLVITGHTHRPRIEWRGETLFVNPGSAKSPRGGRERTLAIVDVVGGRPQPRIVVL